MDHKRILEKQGLEYGNKVTLADPLHTANDLPLGDRIDRIDVIDPFLAIPIPLWMVSTRRVTGLTLRVGTATLPVASGRWLGLVCKRSVPDLGRKGSNAADTDASPRSCSAVGTAHDRTARIPA